jgi:hypothetical protein
MSSDIEDDDVDEVDDYDDDDTSILEEQENISQAILQMFLYLEEGYSLSEIMEDSSSLRSAKILCPELGLAFTDLETLIDEGVPINECEIITQ